MSFCAQIYRTLRKKLELITLIVNQIPETPNRGLCLSRELRNGVAPGQRRELVY